MKMSRALFILAALIIIPMLALAQGPPPPGYPDQGSPQQSPPPPGYPQGQQQPPPPSFRPDQLDQLVARVALYPDSLLAQVLAAATFPQKIPDAERWAD